MSASSQAFADFPKLKLNLPSLRVDDLKAILREVNRQIPGAYTRLTGRKDDLVLRIEDQLLDAIATQNTQRYELIKRLIFPKTYQPPPAAPRPNQPIPPLPSTSATSSMPGSNRAPAPTTDYGTASLARLANYDAFRVKADPTFGTTSTPGLARPPALTAPSSNPALLGSAGFKRPFSAEQPFTSYANNPPAPASRAFRPGTYGADNKPLPVPFEPSPFYRFDSAASGIAICHRAGQNDRRSVSLTITLSSDQRAKLLHSQPNSTGPQYRLRLFCTSDKHFNHPSFVPQGPALPPAPTDYPVTCELKLNNCVVNANVRGLKKQPGTAPPPDLAAVPGPNGIGHALNLKDFANNRIDVIYTNAERRYYCIVYLVEHFSISLLLKHLKAGRQRSKEEVLEIIKAGSGDDEVFTSSSVLALVDPLVMTRIQTPVRSLKCTHLQCFDAEMFYTMMESTPTWLCPICNTKLNADSLTIDGYFQSILKAVPTSIDSVIVEADGTWHDEAFRYGTSPKPSTSTNNTGGTSKTPDMPASKPTTKRNVMVLDLDEEDDHTSGSRKRSRSENNKQEPVCIDLTSDD